MGFGGGQAAPRPSAGARGERQQGGDDAAAVCGSVSTRGGEQGEAPATETARQPSGSLAPTRRRRREAAAASPDRPRARRRARALDEARGHGSDRARRRAPL